MPSAKMPKLIEFKPFISAGPKGLEASKKFYEALGFDLMWERDTTCAFDTGLGKFLIERHQGEGADEGAKHQMLHLWAKSVDDWYAYLRRERIEERFEGVKIAAPEVMPWGLRVCFVWDPAGVLLHIAEPA